MISLPILGDERPERKGPRQWRSHAQLENTPDFQAQHSAEFVAGATDAPSQANRRQFLQLTAASMALAGLTACRRPVELILPYTRKPEEVIEGISRYYATAMPHRGHVRAVLAESHEGRPTKLEGNPEHPLSEGASGVFEQASILNLYDPDRSRTVRQGADLRSWAEFVAFAATLQGPVWVVSEPTSSPTVARLRSSLLARFPGSRWMTYRAEGDDSAMMGAQLATGRPLRVQYNLDQAQTIVSLDADFLGTSDPNEVYNCRTFAQSRRPESGRMSRLYVVESTHSTTGGNADHRLRMRASQIGAFAAALAGGLGVGAGTGVPVGLGEREQIHLDAMLSDLRAAGSRGVVMAGQTQPPEVHALALAINDALGSIGAGTVSLFDTGEEPVRPQGEQMRELVTAMRSGLAQNVVFLGVNPAYDAPAEFDFAAALRGVRTAIHIGHHIDETAALCTWHLPRTHYLEAWGDGRAYNGILSVIQPIVAPLNLKTENGRERNDLHSEIEILNLLAEGTDVSGYDLVRETWRAVLPGNFEQAWREVVHDGFLPDSGFAATSAGVGAVALPRIPSDAELEVVFRLDSKLLDGSFANNAWLLELPDMVTKIVWDNVALMSRTTARALELDVVYREGQFYADVIEINVGGRLQALPVWILPGHPDNAITVHMGWGRDIAALRPERNFGWFDRISNADTYTDVYGFGAVSTGVGVNVAPLRPATYSAFAPATVRKVASDYYLVSTQEHGSMEERPIILEAPLDAYQANPAVIYEQTPHVPGGGDWELQEPLWGSEREAQNYDFFKDNPYYRNQWGMVVDLTTCMGCQACVVACQAENNIQVVGKDQVGRGREMHWLRIDRYYIGEDEDTARMGFQYLTCVHCESAPCEPVCPVAATSHSPDGINEMTYNRCVGTRYCSNNCPYKVRRYNWYNWTKTLPLEVQMQQNPNVTVRFRGVMEKCTYCVQRVREAQQRANIEVRNVRDGEVQTACQQACPAQAIVFGDLADPDSAVSKAKRNPRRYELLAELGTRPRTSYLGRIRNLHPRLAALEPQEIPEPHPLEERKEAYPTEARP